MVDQFLYMQQGALNLTLWVGDVRQQITVTEEAPIVNTSMSSTSGIEGP
jgi:hypothetical protein